MREKIALFGIVIISLIGIITLIYANFYLYSKEIVMPIIVKIIIHILSVWAIYICPLFDKK